MFVHTVFQNLNGMFKKHKIKSDGIKAHFLNSIVTSIRCKLQEFRFMSHPEIA